jgi:hypothetical protein
MPRLLRDIVVSSLRNEHGMEVVDVAEAETDRGRLLDETGCQVLLLSCDRGELPQGTEDLLRDRPWLRVVAIESDGRQASVYEAVRGARASRRPVGEVSMAGLAAVIRASIPGRDAEE